MKGTATLRIVGWGIAITLLALPLVGLLEGWFAVDRWPVRSLHLEAEMQHVSSAQIRAAVTPLLARGFFALDIDRVQQAVATLPWVEHAEVRKQWPDTVSVRVYEQQPFAHWGDTQLINRRGQLFSVPAAASLQGLPHLSGPRLRMDDVVRFYLDARREFNQRGLTVDGAHLSDRGAWRLNLAGDAELMVGVDQPQRRLQRFLDTWPELTRGHANGFVYADLRYPNGFAVRWTPPPAVPAPASGGSPQT